MKLRLPGMTRANPHADPPIELAAVAALRIEDDRLLLAVATPSGTGYRVSVDRVDCQQGNGWITGKHWEALQSAVEHLQTLHDLDNMPIAVSLSGDFCVTRISTGPSEEIESQLESLNSRIPRYLQLGPGEKVIGRCRTEIEPGVEHAISVVGNDSVLQSIYSVLLRCDVGVTWIEPSLVTIARYVGHLKLDHDDPVLIANSFGRSWEVGICHQGRLLLDYRPSAARDSKAFAESITQHLFRLNRFCQRHRGMATGKLETFLIAGQESANQIVVDHFRRAGELSATRLKIDDPSVELVAPGVSTDDQMAAYAAVLPLMESMSVSMIPDLLQQVRREAARPLWLRTVATAWPAMAAAAMLVIAFVGVMSERRLAATGIARRDHMHSQMRATQARLAAAQSTQTWIDHTNAIAKQLFRPELDRWVRTIASCLPTSSHLLSIQVDANGQILLQGHVQDEADLYEIVGYFRDVPGIEQVALLGTSSESDGTGTRFEIRLGWNSHHNREGEPSE